jgi:hypothetical protein
MTLQVIRLFPLRLTLDVGSHRLTFISVGLNRPGDYLKE